MHMFVRQWSIKVVLPTLDVSDSESITVSIWHEASRFEINCKQQCSLLGIIIECKTSLTLMRDGGKKTLVYETQQILAAPPKLNCLVNSTHLLWAATKTNASSTKSSLFSAAWRRAFIWNHLKLALIPPNPNPNPNHLLFVSSQRLIGIVFVVN